MSDTGSKRTLTAQELMRRWCPETEHQVAFLNDLRLYARHIREQCARLADQTAKECETSASPFRAYVARKIARQIRGE